MRRTDRNPFYGMKWDVNTITYMKKRNGEYNHVPPSIQKSCGLLEHEWCCEIKYSSRTERIIVARVYTHTHARAYINIYNRTDTYHWGHIVFGKKKKARRITLIKTPLHFGFACAKPITGNGPWEEQMTNKIDRRWQPSPSYDWLKMLILNPRLTSVLGEITPPASVSRFVRCSFYIFLLSLKNPFIGACEVSARIFFQAVTWLRCSAPAAK